MAHFAKIGMGNIVEQVLVVSNEVATTEQAGVDFLKGLYGNDTEWVQTSYNTKRGEHTLGGTPLRKNFAGIGWKYDLLRDAFIPKKEYGSWSLNEETCLWEPPVEKPELTEQQIQDDLHYIWNEIDRTWDLKPR
mgnify:CR=1 FL=1